MTFQLEVETLISQNEEIIQQTVYSRYDEMRERLWSELYDLKEKSIHDALIKLGWTPPNN